MLMAYPYNLLNNTKPVMIGSLPYLNFHHNPIMYHIGLTCNIINVTLYASQRKSCCKIFLLPLEMPHIGNIPT